MKKKVLKCIASVLIFGLLLPIAIGVGVDEVYGLLSGSSFSSYITFKNAKNEESALYVNKKVTNASDEHPAPEDDEFEFVIRINDSVAKDVRYTLYDAEGRRIYNYETGQTTEKDDTQLEIALKTDRYGRFYLKAGQTARFGGLRAGTTYEVTESECLPYIQVQPSAGSSAVGTLTVEGTKETFENLYPSAESGTLQVRKSVSYPENYEIPATPDFEFAVMIDGSAWAEKEYTVKSISTDQKLSTGTTDADGHFTLQGDTYAVFNDIPVDVDYSVEEIIDGETAAIGWRSTGETVQEGATSADGTTLNFSNVLASFAVSKEIFGGTGSDQIFEFQVTDGGTKPFGKSIPYYLYDGTLQLVDEEVHMTGTDGTFTLMAGQRAVFTGLAKDTRYGVREIGSGKYFQMLPASAGGYTDKIVLDSVEVLPFVNAYESPVPPSKGLLTVKKTIVDNSENSSVPDVEFTFVIYKAEGGAYEPYAYAPYNITDGNGTRTYEADENGRFKLRAWETARFTLPKDNEYKVEEVVSALPTGFEIGGSASKEGFLSEDTVAMEFENTYKGVENPYVAIEKVNKQGELISGATLQLIKKHGDDEIVIHEWVSGQTAEEFQAEPGTYYIRELKAPEGYEVAEDVKIKLENRQGVQTFSMTDKRSTDVPTGLEKLREPLVRALIGLLIAAAAGAAVYFGVIKRRKKDS